MPEHDDPSQRLDFAQKGARLPVRSIE